MLGKKEEWVAEVAQFWEDEEEARRQRREEQEMI